MRYIKEKSMLKAYSIFKDLDKKACEILRNAGIQLDISNSVERPNKEELIRLLNDYNIRIKKENHRS